MSRNVSFRDRVRYGVDQVFSHGGGAMIVVLALLSALLVIAAGAVVALGDVRPPGEPAMSMAEATWASLMRTLDPGTMGGDEGWGFRWVMFGVTLGGIFVISALIGTITSGIATKLDDLGKGRTRVIESGHTLILGWSEQVFTLVEELCAANANRRRPRIVVLGDEDKERMEDQIAARVPDTRGTRVICRTGSAIDPGDLDIVSLDAARSIVIVSPDTDEPDSEVIKSILGIVRRKNRRPEPYHAVAVIREESHVSAAEIARGDRMEVELVRASRLAARVIAQTCRQPGLSTVYSELLDFEGDEIYFQHEPRLIGRPYGQALLAYEDSAVMGLMRGGSPQLNPVPETVIGESDEVIAISRDDDTVQLPDRPVAAPDEAAFAEASPRARAPERTLLLGWNWRAPVVLQELDHYVARGSSVSIVTAQDVSALVEARCGRKLENVGVAIQQADPTHREVLSSLPLSEVDHIVLLSDTRDGDPQQADARTLLTLLHLRDLAARRGLSFSIVTEIRDPRNQRLAERSERPDDFVISDRLVSQVMAQVSENRHLNAVFIDLFDPEGAEIYLKPAGDYVALERDTPFSTVVASAARRAETAIGYRIHSRKVETALGHGVVLNPRKSAPVRFGETDAVIVLAED